MTTVIWTGKMAAKKKVYEILYPLESLGSLALDIAHPFQVVKNTRYAEFILNLPAGTLQKQNV